ncbi:DnaD domain-containing protein [Granulicatella seriolae]|uniref:DnaD domain protein n=1 Tax=Granulicatella seriolae TaxID=2967226 RepID=A0ABT1WMY6_9LACT|nr:DnaD domain protein [Granulicatella seriolae]
MNSEYIIKWLSEGQVSIPRHLMRHYRTIGLNADEVLFIAQLLSIGPIDQLLIDAEQLSLNLNVTIDTIFMWIDTLVRKKCLSINQVTNQQGKKEDRYSLLPMFQELELIFQREEAKEERAENQNILAIIEQEFGRSLSAYELQTVASWLDQDKYSFELIQAALKEAVLSQVFNLNYMDKILLTWQRKEIKTLQQVLADKQDYRKGTIHAPELSKPSIHVPIEKWN